MLIKLSATAIDNFQACNTRWRNSNVYRVRQIKQTTAKRKGTSWHKLHELNDISTAEGLKSQLEYLNDAYAEIIPGVNREDWLVERATLMYSMIGFNWYFEAQPMRYTVIANELSFEMPLYDAEGNIVPDVVVVGKIDQLVADEYGIVYVREFKSSAKSLDDSYWDNLNMDPQVSIYIQAVNWMLINGQLIDYGILTDAPMITKVLYNVWHKPGINPKFLSQKDTQEIFDTGAYCGQEFKTTVSEEVDDEGDACHIVTMDDEPIIVKEGKKGFAIYETSEMYGARLLNDITERPEFYYQQRELCRTPQEMTRFSKSLINIVKMMQYQYDNDLFYECSKECRSRFRCDYCELCEHNIELDPANPPVGYEVVE